MKVMTKTVLFIAVISLPAVVAIVHGQEWAGRQNRVDPFGRAPTASVQRKQQLALVSRASAQTFQDPRLSQAGNPPPLLPPFGPPHPPHGPAAPPVPPIAMLPPPPPGPITRSACEDRINRAAAHAAFIKSKLRLQPKQREAWQKMEDAAQPAVDKLHAACDGLPDEANVPPSLPDLIDAMEQRLSARVELLRAVREPMRALYGTLSPEQRTALQPPRLPPMRPLPDLPPI